MELVKSKGALSNSVEALTLFSDSDGRISVTGRIGTHLYVGAVSKDGYLCGPLGKTSFGYGLSFENNFTYTNPAIPVVFNLWKQGIPGPFIGRHYEVRIIDSQSNRQEGWVNLITGEVEPENNGGTVDLVIRDLDPTEEQRRRRIARVIELEMINGGIQETSDVLPYRAPDAGYAPRLTLEIDERSARSFPIRKRNVYVQLRNGRLYGGLISDLWTERIFTLDTWINPSGSRNLEPDPAKQVTDETEIRRLDLETSK